MGQTDRCGRYQAAPVATTLVLRSVKTFTKSFELGKYRLCGGGPHEGFGVLVVGIDEGIDLTLEFSH